MPLMVITWYAGIAMITADLVGKPNSFGKSLLFLATYFGVGVVVALIFAMVTFVVSLVKGLF